MTRCTRTRIATLLCLAALGVPQGARADFRSCLAGIGQEAAASGIRGIVSARRSNQPATARACASHDSIVFISARKVSPPGSPFSVQPMCFLALRTPANSP